MEPIKNSCSEYLTKNIKNNYLKKIKPKTNKIFNNINIPKQTSINNALVNNTLREQAIYKTEALERMRLQDSILKTIREFVQKHPEYRKVDYMVGNCHVIYEGPANLITDKGMFIQKNFAYITKQPMPKSYIEFLTPTQLKTII